MPEDVTYATLTFQDSAGARNNQNRNNLRKRAYPTLSPIWRHTALGLLILCLMLVIALIALGTLFLQMSHKINSDSETFCQLQKVIQPRQDNTSKLLNFPTEDLKSQISNLLKRQGRMAIKLCQELITHTSGNQDLLSNQINSVATVEVDDEPPWRLKHSGCPATSKDVVLEV